MISFLFNRQPQSFNTKDAAKKAAYKAEVINAYNKYNPRATPLVGELYGIVYYFHRDPTGLDADNLSKRLWDALSKTAYVDDNAVKIRFSGIFDLSRGSGAIDFTSMPARVFADFVTMIGTEKHTVYVECGKINYDLYRFGCEVP